MKKKIILRSALGFPLGIAIGYLITIIISLIWADGHYSPCVPELAAAMGNELRAVILQAFLSGILGAGFGACSIIWEIESWGVVKQTGVYFGAVSAIMAPVAYFACWMEHSVKGFLRYFGIFTLIFLVIWVEQFLTGKYTVKKLNENLYKAKDK